MLSFALYARTINAAIPLSNEDLVNLLIGCIYKPANLPMGKKEKFYLDKKYASYYMTPNPKYPIHKEIIRASGDSAVVNSAVEYFENRVFPEINQSMVADMLDRFMEIIKADATISPTKKSELLKLANRENMAEFLSSLLLYSINKPNVLDEQITEHNNLPPQNPYFTGRADQLSKIHHLLGKQGDAVNIRQTISGLGGIGKTQLAIQYAYSYGSIYKSCIWFVNAETSTTAQNYFVNFARHFNIHLPPDFSPEDLQQGVKTWLNQNKNWLIIFDNIETTDTIVSYIPQKHKGRIIITTRNTEVDFGKHLPLEVFDMDDALDFLSRRFSEKDEENVNLYNESDFETAAPKLITRLGHLPLALEQAAAYIIKVKCSITDYLVLLDESGLLAFEEEQSTPTHYNKESNFEKIVTVTWDISFKNIANEGARQLLNLCAYMAPDRIPVSFFEEMREKLPSPIKEDMAEQLTRNRIVSELRTYSLTSGDAKYINVHRLVQEVIRKRHKELGE